MLSFHTLLTFSSSFCPLQKPTLSTFTKWTTKHGHFRYKSGHRKHPHTHTHNKKGLNFSCQEKTPPLCQSSASNRITIPYIMTPYAMIPHIKPHARHPSASRFCRTNSFCSARHSVGVSPSLSLKMR